MRRTLQTVYSTVSPSFITATVDVEPHAHPQDFDRFLEVYDVRKDDIEDAKIGFIDVQQEELESLRSLKLYQYRLSTLRRLLLCTLLSIPATGRQADAVRWRIAVAVMEYLTQLLKDSNEILKKLMQDEQQLPIGARASRPSSFSGRPHSTPAVPASPVSPPRPQQTSSTAAAQTLPQQPAHTDPAATAIRAPFRAPAPQSGVVSTAMLRPRAAALASRSELVLARRCPRAGLKAFGS